jgi:DNA-binding MarR family transcriptional regulator
MSEGYLTQMLASLVGLRMLPNGDMTVRQLILLLAVNIESGPHTVRGLATQFLMSRSDVSRALDRLEEVGLIKRGPDARDRRSVAIHGTPAGRALVRKIEIFATKGLRATKPRRSTAGISADD